MNRLDRSLLAGSLLLAVMSPVATAQTTVVGVRDRAGIFSKEATADADRELRRVYDASKWQIAVESIDRLPKGESIKQQAIAKARQYKIHGVYVLLSQADRAVFAEPSREASKVFNSSRCEAMVQAIVTGMKAGKPDEGLKSLVAQAVKATGTPTTLVKSASPPPVQASPTKTDQGGVHDVAGLFSADVVRKADTSLKQLASRTKWQVVVETVPTLNGQDIREATIERAKGRNIRGLFVLIDRAEHKFQVEASHSAASVFPQSMRDEIAAILTTNFKANQFDKGLTELVNKVQESTGVATAVAAPPTKPGNRPTSPPPIVIGEATARPSANERTPTATSVGDRDDAGVATASPSTAGSPPRSDASRGTRPTRTDTPSEPRSAPVPAPADSGLPRWLIFAGLIAALVIGFWLIRRLFGNSSQPSTVYSSSSPAGPPPQHFGPAVGGQPVGGGMTTGMGGQPGYGYGPPQPPARGGGLGSFVTGALGGAAGAVVGNVIYDQFGRPHPAQGADAGGGHPFPSGTGIEPPVGTNRGDAGVGGSWDSPSAPPVEQWGDDPGVGGSWGQNPPSAGADWGAGEPGTADGGGADWGSSSSDHTEGTGDDWGDDPTPDDSAGAGGDWDASADAGSDPDGTGGNW